MSHDMDDDRPAAMLIAVPDDLADDLLAEGLVAELPSLRYSVLDAVLTIGSSIVTVVTLSRAPDKVRALSAWLHGWVAAGRPAMEIRATRRSLVLRVDGTVPAEAIAAFITSAFSGNGAVAGTPLAHLHPGGLAPADPPVSGAVDTDGQPPTQRARVFICYAHDSEEHKAQVRQFAAFLTRNGMDVTMDAWSQQKRRDWHQWATRAITEADYVLVIASPKCRLVGDGDNAAHEHRGLRSELNLLRELYHSEPAIWPERILPVVLSGRSVTEIPLFLQPQTANHYIVKDFTIEGSEDLMRQLTRQPPHLPPPPGQPPVLPPTP